jgi:hypothetical protein
VIGVDPPTIPREVAIDLIQPDIQHRYTMPTQVVTAARMPFRTQTSLVHLWPPAQPITLTEESAYSPPPRTGRSCPLMRAIACGLIGSVMAATGSLPWGFWKDYPKVRYNGREYAQIGTRLYTEHAVQAFLPSGRRTVTHVPKANGEGGGYSYDENARSIPPTYVEETIRRGIKEYVTENSELRTVHTLGTIMVVTTRDDKIVITVGNRH